MTQPTRPLPFGAGIYAGVLVTATQRAFIEGGINRGLSGNAIYAAMLAVGIAPRRQALFDVRRELLGIERAGRVIKNTPRALVPSIAAFPQTNVRWRRHFRVIAKTTLFVPSAGGPRALYAVHSFDKRMSRERLDRLLRAQLGAALESFGLSDEAFTFTEYRGEAFLGAEE